MSDAERVAVYLDDGTKPIAEYSPPARISVDTTQLSDGEHELRIEASGSDDALGLQRIPFEVRNGPAISIEGLRAGDVVEGDLDVVVHAWGGASQGDWEPERVESPAPIPTWAWVLLISIIAWALYYGTLYWQPGESFQKTPTYQNEAVSAPSSD